MPTSPRTARLGRARVNVTWLRGVAIGVAVGVLEPGLWRGVIAGVLLLVAFWITDMTRRGVAR